MTNKGYAVETGHALSLPQGLIINADERKIPE